MNKNVPMAYQPYNSIQTNLWNDPEAAAKLEERGYTRAVRRPQVYEGPYSKVPIIDDEEYVEDVVATEEAGMTTPASPTEAEAGASQPASPLVVIGAATGPPAAPRRLNLLKIERRIAIDRLDDPLASNQTIRKFSDKLRENFQTKTGNIYDGSNKGEFSRWLENNYINTY
jgi:hypothetical protein